MERTTAYFSALFVPMHATSLYVVKDFNIFTTHFAGERL